MKPGNQLVPGLPAEGHVATKGYTASMRLRMWTYDLAREQHADEATLRELFRLSVDSGYNALGLYLEHRFAYPSTPWAHGVGCLQPETVVRLQNEFRERLQIVPFVNLLGHFEGFLYAERGKPYAAERFRGLQADAANPEFAALARRMLDDVLEIFTSDIVHLGGDETAQLGLGPYSAEFVAQQPEGLDAKAELYGRHFGPLAQRVLDAGRTPAVWADMFAEHPAALEHLPKDTLLFDWRYFGSPEESARGFQARGHRVVLCPALHTYNAAWLHLPQSERNVRDHVATCHEIGAEGVCVTTWEAGLFGSYETMLPAIRGAGQVLNETPSQSELPYEAETEAPVLQAAYLRESERHEEWARLMGRELNSVGGSFAFGGIRSSLKCRFLLYSNPFLLWLHHEDEFLGPIGDRAISLADRALPMAPDAGYRAPAQLVKSAVEFVRFSSAARLAYATGHPGQAAGALAPCRQIFTDLEVFAHANHLRFGGSLADVHRCRAARSHVETVLRRVKDYGDGSLGYLPAWEVLTHPKFIPHDQASWWLINRWANE